MSKCFSNRVTDCCICPVGFSDHHLISMTIVMSKLPKKSSYWHFNVKLLQDAVFCDNFNFFWEHWRKEKNSFENLKQWWDVGKIQIKMFCQQYTANSSNRVKNVIETLEKQINLIESQLMDAYDSTLYSNLQKKKKRTEFGFKREGERSSGEVSLSVSGRDGCSNFFFL